MKKTVSITMAAFVLLAANSCFTAYSDNNSSYRAGNEENSTSDIGLVLYIKERSPAMSGYNRGSITYAVEVSNNLSEPIRLMRVSLQSSGSGAAQLASGTTKKVDRLLAPGEIVSLDLVGDYEETGRNVRAYDTPLIVRAAVEFEQGAKKRREHFTRLFGS